MNHIVIVVLDRFMEFKILQILIINLKKRSLVTNNNWFTFRYLMYVIGRLSEKIILQHVQVSLLAALFYSIK